LPVLTHAAYSSAQMAKLFLSYRRSDCGPYAERLAHRLRSFQFDTVFLDRDNIRLADDFADRIRSGLSQSVAMLVLIGKGWSTAQDDAGRRRLDDPTDWVRREVALAFSLTLPVIPVLFDAARMPSPTDLPAELAPLATRQGYDISGNYFDRDADDLARKLEGILIAGARPGSSSAVARVSTAFLRQLQIIWLVLSAITAGVAIAPAFLPALPQTFWLFPCCMTVAAFLWWLYWLGESARPARLAAT